MQRSILFLYGLLLCAAAASGDPSSVIINPGKSYIRVAVSASPPHQFTCNLTAFEVNLELDPVTDTILKTHLSFPFASLESGNGKRDRKMVKWMETERYPQVDFELDHIEETVEGSQAVGTLRMHGVEREIMFPCSWESDEGKFVVEGHYILDYLNWGLPKIRLLIFTVKPELEIQFHLEGTYAAAN